MFKRIVATIILLAVSHLARGGEISTCEFPFSFEDGLIRIQVSTPQSDRPLQFLLDSGASVSVINLETARRMGLKLGRPVRVKGVGGDRRGYWPLRLDASIDAAALPSRCLAVDLSKLSDSCVCHVDGLLGADFFREHVVQLDFANRLIRLNAGVVLTEEATVLDLKTIRGALLTDVSVNGGAVQMLRVDTGCVSALQWVNATNVNKDVERRASVALVELKIPATTSKVRLGNIEFDAVPTGLHRKPIFHGEYGLLGNALLSRFKRVTFDARAARLILD